MFLEVDGVGDDDVGLVGHLPVGEDRIHQVVRCSGRPRVDQFHGFPWLRHEDIMMTD
jgi:hypothetical protein